MVLFVLILYWAASERVQFNEHPALAALLVGYFGFLTIADYVTLRHNHPHLLQVIFYNDTVIILLRFLAGCTLAIALSVLSSRERNCRS